MASIRMRGNEQTALHRAAAKTEIVWNFELPVCLEIFKRALEAAENPMAPDSRGRTPLHYAAKTGFYEAIQLLPISAENVNAVDDEGKTALHYAVLSLRSEDGFSDFSKLNEVLSHAGLRFQVEKSSSLLEDKKRLVINALLDAGADPI